MRESGIVHIVGVDLEQGSGQMVVPPKALQKCAAIVGTGRFLELVRDLPRPAGCELVPITPLERTLEIIENHCQQGSDTVVLASGDPLLYGIAKTITQLVGGANTKVYPAVSSVQLAFSRFGICWDDARLISLHGRVERNYLGKILASAKSAVLTDGVHRAEVIAADMCDFLGDQQQRFTVHVAENIGLEDERLFSGTPEQVSREVFGGLAVVIVLKDGGTEGPGTSGNAHKQIPFGLKEEDINHSRGLITKHEIRAAAIHLLQVPKNSILWDVGAGSGSVGLEVARMYRDTLVYAIEKNGEQHQNILANKEKFDLVNLRLIPGDAPESFAGLPAPDRVFIGGSGGNLSDIIRFCNQELAVNGVMIVTAVLEKTRTLAPEFMHQCGLNVETHTIAVTRSSYPGKVEITLNPITIIVGRKQAAKE